MTTNKNDQLDKTSLVNDEADRHFLSGDHQKALELYLENIDTTADSKDYKSQAKTLSNVGLIEAGMGLNEDSITHFNKALKLFERLGDKHRTAEMWGNIGSTYRNMEAFDQSIEAYLKALPLYEELDHKLCIGDQYTNMAYIHTMRGDIEEAVDLYRKALPLYESSGDSRRINVTEQNLQGLLAEIEKGAQ